MCFVNALNLFYAELHPLKQEETHKTDKSVFEVTWFSRLMYSYWAGSHVEFVQLCLLNESEV